MYRLKYKFAINIFIISEKNKNIYINACNNEESDLEDIFYYLSSEMNIFSYIVPAFSTAPNYKKIIERNNFRTE